MTKIPWTDLTWNPIVGCSPTSIGCRSCYGKSFAWRLKHNPTFDLPFATKCTPVKVPGGSAVLCHAENQYDGLTEKDKNGKIQWTGKCKLFADRLEQPYKWKKPRKIFVCSMGDLFHKNVPFEWVDDVMEVIYNCPQHTFQILTKRPERMMEYFRKVRKEPLHIYFDNLWLGVSVCDESELHKIDTLRQIPAKVRFLSLEPLLGDVTFNGTIDRCIEYKIKGISQIIVGGETGTNARPVQRQWIEHIMGMTRIEPIIPFFFKGWGTGTKNPETGKKFKKTDPNYYLIDGKEYKEFPD